MKTLKKFIKRYGWRCFTWRILIFPVVVLGYLIGAIGGAVICLCLVLVGEHNEARRLYQDGK
jgi:hypothetical protein